MILIVDNSYRRFPKEIREKLLGMGIPCALTNCDNIDIYLPAAVVIVTERYILRDVEYMASMHRPSPIVLYDEVSDFFEFVMSVCRTHCPSFFEGDGSLGINGDGNLLVRGHRVLTLTKTQKRIARMLMTSDEWFGYEQISLYCLKSSKLDKKSVAVHICNINKKFNLSSGRDFIACRRYSGYRLNEY